MFFLISGHVRIAERVRFVSVKDGKVLFIKYEQLAKASEDWKKKAWAKLEKKLEETRAQSAETFEREPGAEGLPVVINVPPLAPAIRLTIWYNRLSSTPFIT
ncbi:hypothetical protein [Geobacter sp. DSM 9736]|uniref:hypothetical protein n=1 Tax=Geobacter sp. DSM 9736 TaxID=1277350 RepID=UPI000B50A6E4|nr:hypothetical protein [Geobacter sp. DSM 9736]